MGVRWRLWIPIVLTLATAASAIATIPVTAGAAGSASPTTSILFIGDDLSTGVCSGPTYTQSTFRDDALIILQEEYDITAIGSQWGPEQGCYLAPDRSHESYAGLEADQIATNLEASLPGLTESTVAFILAGSNDVYTAGQTPAEVLADIQLIIDEVEAHSSSTAIVLAQIPNSGGFSQDVADLNSEIENLASSNGYTLADFNTGITAAEQSDGFHFNDSGAAIVGARAAAAIESAAGLIALGVGGDFTNAAATEWGLRTKGNSQTIADWEALGWAIEQVDNTIFVGGNFLEVTTTHETTIGSQPYLAAFDADTGEWQAWWRPELDGPVFALQASPDGHLLVGGEFSTWNGDSVGSFVKIDPATGDRLPVAQFDTRIFGGADVVRDLKIEDDGNLYAVGQFSTVAEAGVGTAVSGAVRMDPVTGAVDLGWIPLLHDASISPATAVPTVIGPGTGWGVSRSETNGTIYIVGYFQAVNGLIHTRGFAGVNDAGVVVLDRNPLVPVNNQCGALPFCTQLYDVEATDEGTVFVAGVEHSLFVHDETDGFALLRHNYTACNPNHFFNITDSQTGEVCFGNNWFSGEFQELEEVDGQIFATGHFWHDHFSTAGNEPDPDTIGGDPNYPNGNPFFQHANPFDWPRDNESSRVDAIAAYDSETGVRDNTFRPYLTGDSGGFGIHLNESDGCLWLTGGIESYQVTPGMYQTANDLVRLCGPGGPGPAAATSAVAPAPTTCGVSLAGPDQATVIWADQYSGIDQVRIERQTDGGNWAPVNGSPVPHAPLQHIDTAPFGTNNYRVAFKYVGNQLSVTFDCQPSIVVDLGGTPPPALCSATVDGNNQPQLSWDQSTNATGYIIRRSVNGGNTYWRGKVTPGTTLTFTDSTINLGNTYHYTVEAIRPDGTKTSTTDCTPDLTLTSPDTQPPALCSATVDGNNQPQLSWDQSTNATGYIIRRSVNGGNTYWRGKVTPGTTLTFTDSTINLGNTYHYTVEAIRPDGTKTSTTDCTPDLTLTSPDTQPPALCSATVDGNNQPQLSWDQSTNATGYIIRRSVNGGNTYWRGKVTPGTTLTFTDSTINLGNTYHYTVEAIRPDGTKTSTTDCTPDLTAEAQTVQAHTNCVAEVNGAGVVTITWDANTTAAETVITRSADGGTFYWRGKVPGTVFNDTVNDSRIYTYEIEARAADGSTAPATTCSPDLQL